MGFTTAGIFIRPHNQRVAQELALIIKQIDYDYFENSS